MTKNEALKLALEALENLINYDYSGQPDNGIDLAGAEAITAIKEALAQPDHIVDANKMAQPAQEPFGYFKAEPFGWTDCAETDEGALALYQAPQQRPWVRLTYEDMVGLQKELFDKNGQFVLPTTLAMSVEAKLKEKNT